MLFHFGISMPVTPSHYGSAAPGLIFSPATLARTPSGGRIGNILATRRRNYFARYCCQRQGDKIAFPRTATAGQDDFVCYDLRMIYFAEAAISGTSRRRIRRQNDDFATIYLKR